jgi:hypothetical protein
VHLDAFRGIAAKGGGMEKSVFYWMAVMSFSFIAPNSAIAQQFFKGENWSITFSNLWKPVTVGDSTILKKNEGIGGIAILSCVPGQNAPNIDSLAKFYGDSLGGHITMGKDSVLPLGAYQVYWHELKYDSLPKLNSMLAAQASSLPIPPLRNGSFRIYYLESGGFVFSIIALPIFQSPVLPPYAEVEAALTTLKLGALAGIQQLASKWDGVEMWIHDGRVGGAWFSAHKPRSIDCFNVRGAWIGSAKSSGSAGIWILPSVAQNSLMRILLSDGSYFNLRIRD